MKFTIACVGILLSANNAAGQIPEKFENLEILPKDISRQQLTQIMRSFSMGLGVRCQYCHVVKTPATATTAEALDFKADDKIEKKKARVMMKMTRTINAQLLADLPERSTPEINVQCVTCHRGSPQPKQLERVLTEVMEKEGIDSAVVRYRQLRDLSLVQGRYNFSQQTLNELARQLTAAGKTNEAIRWLEVNREFNPASVQIDILMGEAYLAGRDNEKAKASFRRALEKQPNHPEATRRLKEIS